MQISFSRERATQYATNFGECISQWNFSYNNFKKSRGADISSRGGITSATTAHGGPPDGSISNENRSGHSGREQAHQ